ncbi:MAG TPA: WD40 repeat domain-containing protein, partial [Bacteroidia bacterium]|nr:WD40 repeat domain-containing protein [Bacteroidia bacterium]
HDIRFIGVDYMLYNLLGGTFEPLKNTYYTTISNYVVFANSVEALQMFINRYESGYTLEKDSYYRSFINDHLESESGIYIYSNVALSPMLYEQYLDKPYAEAMKRHTDIMRKTQAIGIQFNFMQGMFYTDVYVKRNPDYKKQAGALWQVALDTTIAGHPFWVTDHKTKYQYVFAQDKADNIYLISNTGHIQWKKEAEGRIMSPVYTVDVMRNGKSQYLYNTHKTLCIVDRNGKDMYGFPINIPNKASGPVTCLDYDNNRKYRLLVPCTDGKLRMYDIGGKSVKEWVIPETDAAVTTLAKHITIDDKDYIIVVDEHGKVYGFDKKGKSRLTLQQRLPEHLSTYYLEEGKRLDDTYLLAADSLGTVYKLSLTDVMTHTQYLSNKNERFDFAPVDLDGKGKSTMLFLSHFDLYAYGLDKAKLFHYSVRDSVSRKLIIFKYSDGKARIGAIDTKNNKIYIWDEQGNLCNGFPLYGSTEFEIADMNADGQLYLVTGASDGNVYVYSLP